MTVGIFEHDLGIHNTPEIVAYKYGCGPEFKGSGVEPFSGGIEDLEIISAMCGRMDILTILTDADIRLLEECALAHIEDRMTCSV